LQGGQEGMIVYDGIGRRKGSQKILFPEYIDAILDPHGRIVLRQYGGRYPDKFHAPVRYSCGIAHHIYNSAPTYGDNKGMPTDPILVNALQNPFYMAIIIFTLFPARDNNLFGTVYCITIFLAIGRNPTR